MNFPNPRGSLSGKGRYVSNVVDENAPLGLFAHFPAGSKSTEPSAGVKSQMKAYNGSPWVPFRPLNPVFKWRTGVCGDEKGSIPEDHLRGGKYYYNGKIVKSYKMGAKIDVQVSINAHHNGFMELHLCHCDGDISESYF